MIHVKMFAVDCEIAGKITTSGQVILVKKPGKKHTFAVSISTPVNRIVFGFENEADSEKMFHNLSQKMAENFSNSGVTGVTNGNRKEKKSTKISTKKAKKSTKVEKKVIIKKPRNPLQ